MSTRATYQFDVDMMIQTFYIHHDGYPTGAAEYFDNALNLVNSSGSSFAAKFIRANAKADFTESHEVHGDTDYRYTVRRDPPSGEFMVHVEQVEYDHKGNRHFQTRFDGSISEFIVNNLDRQLTAIFKTA